jgi:hypothetical protein
MAALDQLDQLHPPLHLSFGQAAAAHVDFVVAAEALEVSVEPLWVASRTFTGIPNSAKLIAMPRPIVRRVDGLASQVTYMQL